MDETNRMDTGRGLFFGIFIIIIIIATGASVLHYTFISPPDTEKQFTFSKEELLVHNRLNLEIGDMWFAANTRDTFINTLQYTSASPEMSMFIFHDRNGIKHRDCDVENIRLDGNGNDNYRVYVDQKSSLTDDQIKACLVIALHRAKLKRDLWDSFRVKDGEIDTITQSMIQ